jgi:hypothetical protein
MSACPESRDHWPTELLSDLIGPPGADSKDSPDASAALKKRTNKMEDWVGLMQLEVLFSKLSMKYSAAAHFFSGWLGKPVECVANVWLNPTLQVLRGSNPRSTLDQFANPREAESSFSKRQKM